MPNYVRACVECSMPLKDGAHPNQKTCSDECRSARLRRQVAAAVTKSKRRSAEGLPMKQSVKPITRRSPCFHCGGPIPPERHWNARTCGRECQEAMSKAKAKARRLLSMEAAAPQSAPKDA